MTYGIFTDSGNVVAWYDSQDQALSDLAEMVRDEPESVGAVAVIPFDNAGRARGEAISGTAMLA